MAKSAALEVQVSEDEVHVQRGDVALCFLINRVTSTMRVIDFRSGYQAQKAEIVHDVAQQHGVSRVFVVVEREEAATWNRMGFEREATIPGFYKRSDGHILGLAVEQRAPQESGTRIRVRDVAQVAPSGPAANDRGERAYQGARRFARGEAPAGLTRVKVAEARPQDVQKAIDTATRSGRELTRFEPFGRGALRSAYLCTARGGFSLLVGIEAQPCFDNAFVELLVGPRGEKETWLTVSALRQVTQRLEADGFVSAFALAPVESVELMSALLAAGFKRTGRLTDHLLSHGQRGDAYLWSRKLAEPE